MESKRGRLIDQPASVMHSRCILHSMFYSLLRTVSLQLLLSLPHCCHQLVSLHPPAGNSVEVLGSSSH